MDEKIESILSGRGLTPIKELKLMEKRNEIDHIEREIAIFVRRAEATRIAHLKYKEFDRSTYLLLLKLEEKGPMGIKALADAFQLDISTLSRQTVTMESKGYVVRKSSPTDGRVNLLEITELGCAQLHEVTESRQEFYTTLLSDWSTQECQQFGELLEKFNQTVNRLPRSK
jgi:DNA-binding MarR family transcriptional regulator